MRIRPFPFPCLPPPSPRGFLHAPDLGVILDIRGTLPTLGRAKKYGRRRLDQIIGSVIHFTDGPRNQSIRAVAEWQISDGATPQTGAGQPFPAIAYHYMIKGDGQPRLCHDLETVTWHAGEPANSQRIAIGFTGNSAPTQEQIRGLARAHVSAERTLGWRLSAIPHKQVVNTGCPGTWDTWSPALYAEIARLRGDQVTQPESPPEPPPEPTTKEQALEVIFREAGEIANQFPASLPRVQRIHRAVDVLKRELNQ